MLWINGHGDWVPIEVNQVRSGWRSYAEVTPNGQLEVSFDPPGQAGLADFAEAEVVANLLEEGWLKQSVLVTTEQPTYTPEEMLARGYVIPWFQEGEEEADDVPF